MFEKIYSFFSSKPLAVVFLIMLAFFLASVQTFLYGPVYPDEALYAWNAQKIFQQPASSSG